MSCDYLKTLEVKRLKTGKHGTGIKTREKARSNLIVAETKNNITENRYLQYRDKLDILKKSTEV